MSASAAGLVLRGVLWVAVVAATGCASAVLRPVYEQVPGRFVDHVDPPPPDQDLFADPRERRAFDGQPHERSDLGQLGAWGLVDARELVAYLSSISDRLLDAYPYERAEIVISVTADPAPNASASPFGDVFVARGLLEHANSEDELAFVLAHELAHVLLGHFRRDDYVETQRQAISTAAGAARVGLLLAHSETVEGADGRTRLEVDEEDAMERGALLSYAAYTAVEEGTGRVLEPAWKRAQESEADLLGIDLVVAAGYNATVAQRSIERLGVIEERQREEQRERRARIRATYLPTLTASLASGDEEAMLGAGTAVALQEGTQWLSAADRLLGRGHFTAERRMQELSAYYRREYRGPDVAAPPPLSADRFENHVRQGRTAQILEHHRLATEARKALEEGDAERAAALAKRSISYPTAAAPFPRFVMYQVRKAQGEGRLALLNLQKIETSPHASAVVFAQLADEYLAHERPRDAIRVLEHAIERFDHPPAFLPDLVRAHVAAADEAGLERVLARCEASGDEVTKACQARLPEESRPTEPGTPGWLQQMQEAALGGES